jgi:hypothetical protein
MVRLFSAFRQKSKVRLDNRHDRELVVKLQPCGAHGSIYETL